MTDPGEPLGELVIDARFCGPPASGNGGYVGARLAEFLRERTDGRAARVRLFSPPPLDTPLEVRAAAPDGDGGAGVELWHADTRIAEGRPASLDIAVPEPPSFEAARDASRGYVGFADHPYPTCFVCGPDRSCAGDGLCVFAGALPDREVVAAPWIPDASLRADDDLVGPEFVWAALDCPGCFSFQLADGCAILLGEITVELTGRIAPGDPCVVIGWAIAHEGRKHHTGTAIFGADGERRGRAFATWFDVPAPRPRIRSPEFA
ncbi:MAG TPA: hypothetical protein VK837_02430 [Longimicrobiales bacterium]|nr:hypothetical protein [Longimicrobiales bacterium]